MLPRWSCPILRSNWVKAQRKLGCNILSRQGTYIRKVLVPGLLRARNFCNNVVGRFFDYDIEGKTQLEVADELTDKDAVFMQGGNCFHLLKHMQECHFVEIIKQALSRGVLYIGESAGAIVCGQDITAQCFISGDSFAKVPDLKDYHGLGLVNFLLKPHWNRQDTKREKFYRPIQENSEQFYSIPDLGRKSYIAKLKSNLVK